MDVCVCVCVYVCVCTYKHIYFSAPYLTPACTISRPPFSLFPTFLRTHARTHARTHSQVWGALVRAIDETSAYERRIVLGSAHEEWAAEDNASVGREASELSWFLLTVAPLTPPLVRGSSRVTSRVTLVRSYKAHQLL